MTPLADIILADRRLRILLLLSESTGYTASAELLHTVLPRIGHPISHDRLNTDLEWLHEQDLVGLERIGDVPLAHLTARGLDVAQGVATAPGVARPRPE